MRIASAALVIVSFAVLWLESGEARAQVPDVGPGVCVYGCDPEPSTPPDDWEPDPYIPPTPDPGVASYNQGVSLLDQGDPYGAEAAFRQAIANDPSNGMYWNNLGVALDRQDRVREAMDAFAQAANLGNQLAYENYTKLKAWQDAEDARIAAENYRRQQEALSRRTTDLGLQSLRSGSIEDGLSYLQQAIAADPHNGDAKLLLDYAQSWQRAALNSEQAQAMVSEAIASDTPPSPDIAAAITNANKNAQIAVEKLSKRLTFGQSNAWAQANVAEQEGLKAVEELKDISDAPDAANVGEKPRETAGKPFDLNTLEKKGFDPGTSKAPPIGEGVAQTPSKKAPAASAESAPSSGPQAPQQTLAEHKAEVRRKEATLINEIAQLSKPPAQPLPPAQQAAVEKKKETLVKTVNEVRTDDIKKTVNRAFIPPPIKKAEPPAQAKEVVK